MSNRPTPWLLAAIYERGGMQLLGDEPLAAKGNRWGPHPAVAFAVLCHMAAHATVANRGQVHYSADVIAAETGIARRSVQDSLFALEALGLISRTGKVRRSIRYMVLPEVVAAGLADHERPDERPDERPHERPDERPHERPHQRPHGRSNLNLKENRKEESADALHPPACPDHPNGYRHNQPCRTCADLRRWEAGQPTRIPDTWDAVTAAMAHPCDHGTPGGNPRTCVFCRMPALTDVGAP